MKNHKGTVAALLTLGLVVIGTIITLGTSLFVNNEKNNLSLNSRANEANCQQATFTCPNGTSPIHSAWKINSTYYDSSTCGNAPPFTYFCPTTPPTIPTSGGGGTNEICEYLRKDCFGECVTSLCTSVGCGKKGGITQTYRCKDDSSSATPTQTPRGGTSTGSVLNNGIIEPGENCCFKKKGFVYVYASYDSMEAGDMLDNGGVGDCSRQGPGINRSYGPIDGGDSGAFDCAGGTQNRTPEDEYNEANKPPVGTTCKTSNGKTIPRDGKTYCISSLGPKFYGMCYKDDIEATELECSGTKICKLGKCVLPTATLTPNPTITGIPATPKPGQPSVTPISSPTPTFAPIKCNPFSCFDNSDLEYSVKCANPGTSTCGGQYNLYSGIGCGGQALFTGTYENIINYGKFNYCKNNMRTIVINTKVIIGGSIDYEPTKPNANFQICYSPGDSVSTDIVCPINEPVNLSNSNEYTKNINKTISASGNLICYLSYNPAGLFSAFNTIPCTGLSEKNGQITMDIHIN